MVHPKSLNFHQTARRHTQKIINIKRTVVFVYRKNILLTIIQPTNQPTRFKNNGLLIIPISSTCFGRYFSPTSGALDCVYSLWYNAPTMLPAGNLDEVEQVPPHPGYRPAKSWLHYTTSCKHSLVLLRMGENIALNMMS
jgi:hypothetical protein